MSSDDYIAIVKRYRKYEGYWLSASCEYPTIKSIRANKLQFKVETIEEAILKGQSYQTEYGIHFVNLKLPEKEVKKGG